jgi:chromate reductase, NAD(P)H dehydrogenase (quinone)
METLVTTQATGIHIVLISGSVRPGNYTGKALALVTDEIRKHPDIAAEVIDPNGMDLPFPGTGGSSTHSTRLRESVTRATGVILATPEYHGSFSSVIKLVIENLGFPSALAGKPVVLLGVAAGQIGAIKALEGLSSVCTHVGAIVLPGPVSVANVNRMFDAEGNCLDAGVEKRVRSVAVNLIDYIRGSICPRIAMEAMARGAS